MPVELQVIRAGEFLRLKPDRLLDFEESRKALILLALACRKRGVTRALLDLRDLPVPDAPILKPKELVTLIDSFTGTGFCGSDRLAVLYRVDRWHGVRMFAFIAKLKGCQVRALQDFEEAMEWLAEEPDEKPAHSVPVKVTVMKKKPRPVLSDIVHQGATRSRRLRA